MCELFAYQGKDCHQIYNNIRSDEGDERGHCKLIREHITQLWGQFKPYADPQFIEQFRLNPDQRYWEMYLGCCLLRRGFELAAARPKGPDFSFEHGGKKIWIEAIAPTAGHVDNPNQVPEVIPLSEGGGVQAVPRDKIILRFRSGLDEKEMKFNGYIKDGIVGGDDIKIIALSSAALPRWSKSSTHPYILSAIFPIGHAYITIDRLTGEVTGQGHHFQSAVLKANGAEVETLFFIDPAHSHISAIVYSDADLGNPRSNLSDSLLVIHNPLAVNPLPRGLLSCAREYWAEVDGEGDGNSWTLHHQDFKPSQEGSY